MEKIKDGDIKMVYENKDAQKFIEQFINELLEVHSLETLRLADKWNNDYFILFGTNSPKFQEKGFRDRFCNLLKVLLKGKRKEKRCN